MDKKSATNAKKQPIVNNESKTAQVTADDITNVDMTEKSLGVTLRSDLDVFYAEAWSKKQGHFSFKLANNLIEFLKTKHINIRSVLDVCSGSGEFLSVLRNVCTNCVGVDTYTGYLEFVKSNFPDINFIKVDKLEQFNLKQKFDFVSCNRDVVNMFEKFEQWKTFFDTAYAHLNKNGIFMFDFYTEQKLKNWNTTIFDQSDEIDYVSRIYQQHGKCVFNEVYYLKQASSYYRKTSDIMVEAYFPTNIILSALESAGFSNISLVDIDFKPIVDLSDADRIHILATK